MPVDKTISLDYLATRIYANSHFLKGCVSVSKLAGLGGQATVATTTSTMDSGPTSGHASLHGTISDMSLLQGMDGGSYDTAMGSMALSTMDTSDLNAMDTSVSMAEMKAVSEETLQVSQSLCISCHAQLSAVL